MPSRHQHWPLQAAADPLPSALQPSVLQAEATLVEVIRVGLDLAGAVRAWLDRLGATQVVVALAELRQVELPRVERLRVVVARAEPDLAELSLAEVAQHSALQLATVEHLR